MSQLKMPCSNTNDLGDISREKNIWYAIVVYIAYSHAATIIKVAVSYNIKILLWVSSFINHAVVDE